MKEAVVIKGNKAGMTVYLEKDLDFEKVLQAIAKKFKATAKFWGAAQMTLTLLLQRGDRNLLLYDLRKPPDHRGGYEKRSA